jgi:sialate O-acetylesterase
MRIAPTRNMLTTIRQLPLPAARRLAHLVFAALTLQTAHATVSLPALFADHAVLQRDKPLPIWGWAAPGESVSVTLGTATASTITGTSGRWLVQLPPQPASTQAITLTVAGTNTLTMTDVLLGDVWLCTGQSNMALSVGGLLTPESKTDYQTANFPLIRQMGVEVTPANTPQANVSGAWLPCTPAKASQFCAVGFYFAMKVHRETGVPIGILRSAKGSTIIECWMAEEHLMQTLGIEPYPTQMRDSLVLWETEKAAALAVGILPDAPGFPEYPFSENVRRPRCVTHYNGMIAPLAGLAMRGVIWYQGETNAADLPSAHVAQAYTRKLRAMISNWRSLSGEPALPFYIVQLPNYLAPYDVPAGGDRWSWLREAQRQCLSIPNTHMAVTIDIGEEGDIHPKNKYDVGERLGLLALKHEYGQISLVASGPVFRQITVEGGNARLHFDSIGGGLMAGTKTARVPAVEDVGAALGRFAIAGADNQWVWGNAVIDGDTVVVSSPQVPAPVAVRYAYSTNPTGANLYNRAGLPAGPFLTDAVIVPVTGAPTISDVADQSMGGTAVGPLPFTIGDGETPPAALTVTSRSSNPTLVPDSNIVLGGSGADRTAIVTPIAGQTGSATITLAVSDGTFASVDTFVVTVVSDALPVSGWRSVSDHDGVPHGLAIPASGFIEPRQAGIRRIEVVFSEPITVTNPETALSINGVNGVGSVSPASLDITVQAAALANTLVVSFTNAAGECSLPDATKWRFALTPGQISGASGSVVAASAATTRVLSGLIGDTTGNGRASGIDINTINPAVEFDSLSPAHLRADIDGDGALTTTDRNLAWSHRNNRVDTLASP